MIGGTYHSGAARSATVRRSSRINSLLHDMERAGIEAVNLLTDHRRETDIIPFEPAQRASGRKAENAGRKAERER